jgi:transposase
MTRKAGIVLSDRQRKELTKFMHSTKEAHEYRAALGIVMRGAGTSADKVGRQLGVTANRVFVWCSLYKRKGIDGLRMKHPTDRPACKGNQAKQIIPELLQEDPQLFGFLKGRWVVRDIAKALKEEGVDLSFQQVNRILQDMEITLKSPKLRAPGSIKKNYRKRAEIRRYKKVAPALFKKG